jgi:hypothetical protein
VVVWRCGWLVGVQNLKCRRVGQDKVLRSRDPCVVAPHFLHRTACEDSCLFLSLELSGLVTLFPRRRGSCHKSFDVRNLQVPELAGRGGVVEEEELCGETVEVPSAAAQLLNKILVGVLAAVRVCGPCISRFL